MKRRLNAWWRRWPMALWLAVTWVLMWGDLSLANVLVGLLLGFGLVILMPVPDVGYKGRVWLPGLVVLLGKFAWDVVVASVHLGWYALHFGKDPHGAVIRVPLRTHDDLLLTLTAQFTSLVPGSIIVEAQRHAGVLYVHVFDAEVAGGIEHARRTVLDQERRILYAIGSDEEIARAGYAPRSQWWKQIRARHDEAEEVAR